MQEIKFDHCPNCNSTRQLCMDLAKKAILDGKASPEFKCSLVKYEAVVATQQMQASAKLNDSFDVVTVYTDICESCGTLYAIRIIKDSVVKKIARPKIVLPPNSGN